ncbi:MAG: hypothetical protein ABH887_01115 [bacterium]
MQFILNNMIVPLIYSFFTVIGGTVPIVFLIFLFSKKERKRLLLHTKKIKQTLPVAEQLSKRIFQLTSQSIDNQNMGKSIDNFKRYAEALNTIEEQRNFIKYAESYNFISALGNLLKLNKEFF